MIKPIAIHLPQFHPFAENDEWWGKGFTEWTNVTKAKPQFEGHYQPHLPADLGFYDLRLEESRIAQAELAKAYGIHGFCYYHYWFNGKRLLHRPLDDMLHTQTPDFPFMLCWANENWSRRWDGNEKDVLMHQNYSEQDDIEHIRFLIEHFFQDNRYIKVNDKPFLLIFRPNLIPSVEDTIARWRTVAAESGVELYLGFIKSPFYDPEDFENQGFDCGVQFHPDLYLAPTQEFPPLIDRIKHRLGIKDSVYYKNYIGSYKAYVDKQLTLPTPDKSTTYPGITPGWDNSARKRTGAIIFKDCNPDDYARWLSDIAKRYKGDDTYLFINAWNEWAEGNHLEPCQKWGRRFLEETKKFVEQFGGLL
ncbi:glycoside hydrolase family 99-like domain-containing protein [Mucilaginibacter daejeonensis]|uniref:glycosyltransferase WbsX family protein n=1 Tax=Mucilaginibacter daejeonensis TaxID=398049 RepID=UPI001D171582|nr:glycoside hydrolase family 99-like domain-containing protein [Mucilaginibacter daejeonensis]UEG52974.1 glycoside hydrolase family 99-like domain-containing protein [Mucilaginibacter daejeonensis]